MSDLTFERLRRTNLERSKVWDPTGAEDKTTEDEIDFRDLELRGEQGELANKIKKVVRYIRDMPGGIAPDAALPEIRDELADIIICVDRVADCFDIDLGKAVPEKFNKTSREKGLTVFMDEAGPGTEAHQGLYRQRPSRAFPGYQP